MEESEGEADAVDLVVESETGRRRVVEVNVGEIGMRAGTNQLPSPNVSSSELPSLCANSPPVRRSTFPPHNPS